MACVEAVMLSLAFAATSLLAGVLPSPTGAFGVGRVTFHWIDGSRAEPLAKGRHRELMVDVWYPAEGRTGPRAEYLDAGAFERALGADGLRGLLGTAYAPVKEGLVRTHAGQA